MDQVTEKRVIKLEKEEIDKILSFTKRYGEITETLGQFEISMVVLKEEYEAIEKKKTQLKNQYLKLREQETTLASDLKAKYGEGQIDLESGTFLPKS